MGFEDYNYEMYNKFILIDPNKTPDESYPTSQTINTDSERKVGWAPPKFV